MNFLDTQPAPLHDGDGVDPYAEFRIDRPSEITAHLKSLLGGSTPVQLSTPEGTHLSTALWTVDGAQRRLSFGVDPDQPAVQRLVEADEVTAVAYLDAVKLQFDLESLLLVHGNRACALQATMPRHMYRFQRREGYRVRTLERSSPAATLRHPSMPDMTLKLRVLDVSIGGCSLFLPHDVPTLAPGVRLHRVQIDLDEDTRFLANLLLHHVSSIHSDARGVRLGCQILDLEPASARALQRYIDQTQKRRRLLSLS